MNLVKFSCSLLLTSVFYFTTAKQRPNIIVILADDMGYSDISPYGGEISTPNLAQLAKGGIKFTQFYNAARCCPTRASLLTGLYPHQTGIGNMTADQGENSYRGDLNRQCVTIAEVLKASGYKTYISGKWHVTSHVDQWRTWLPEDKRIRTSKMNWPLQRGFDEFFGTIHGAGSYYNPSTLTRNNTPIEASDDFYYTDEISDHADLLLRQHAEDTADAPFFAYIAYTAPHWPLHALPEDIEKYKGKYDIGWDKVREERMKRMVKMGIINRECEMSERSSDIPAWEEVDNKEWWARCMEVYAAMVDRMDHGIGKVMNALEETNQMENTLILFLADNGGCAEVLTDHWRHDLHLPTHKKDGSPLDTGNDVTRMPGSEDTYMSYEAEWANVSNTPFRMYKHFIHEGGISTPLIAHWPSGIQNPGRASDQVGHLVDIMATCLDISGTTYPERFNGYQITPLEGQSLVTAFNGLEYQHAPIGWEHHGNRGFREGKWKIVERNGNNHWELFNMENDRTEINDLSGDEPDLLEQLIEKYNQWADRVGVIRWRDRK